MIRQAGEEALILEMVHAIRYHHPRMGTRKLLHKMWSQLAQRGISLGRDALFDLLRRHDLLVQPKRRRTITTRSGLWRCPNLLPELTLVGPYQLWVGDITYLTLETGFAYLALLTDAYSRFIVGFDLSLSLAVEGCQRALKCALQQATSPLVGLIHHSDRGVQYLSIRYAERLAEVGIESSVGSVGDSFDNALAETINGLYKTEVIRQQDPWRNIEDVEFATLTWVDWFNNRRIAERIGNVPPTEMEIEYYQQLEGSAMAA